MDWRQGYSARYYATFVDPDSWADSSRIELTGGTIKRATSELLESADINCVNYSEVSERWIRVWLDAMQGNEHVHIPLFTGLAISPGRKINGRLESTTLQCYSALKPAQDILLDRGYYVPMGIDGASRVKVLLSDLKSPVTISEETSEQRSISQTIVAENGETKLSMAWKILTAMNWRMTINGLGEIFIGPYSTSPIITLDSIENDIIQPSLTVDYDWYDCPNVFRATLDNQVAIAKDTSDESLLSIQNRGREVWYEESNCMLSEQETLQEYANRRLLELQYMSEKISYTRRGIFEPELYPTDVIMLNYPLQGISGAYLITSQTVNLDYGAATSEEVIKIDE